MTANVTRGSCNIIFLFQNDKKWIPVEIVEGKKEQAHGNQNWLLYQREEFRSDFFFTVRRS